MKSLWLVSPLVLFAGCELPPESLPPKRNPLVTYTNCIRIVEGRTTADELTAIFGKPTRIEAYGHSLAGEDWIFGDIRANYLQVTLTNGVVRSRTFTLKQ